MPKRPIVYIKFLDHAMGNGETIGPCECEIVGWLREETNKHYIVVSWITDGNPESHNSECYCIVKGTVLQFKKLK